MIENAHNFYIDAAASLRKVTIGASPETIFPVLQTGFRPVLLAMMTCGGTVQMLEN